MAALIDISGTRFGRLVVQRQMPRAHGNTQWLCLCDCGRSSTVSGANLKSGHSQSCGCLRDQKTAQRSITHGETRFRRKSVEYRTYTGMLMRCFNPRDEYFSIYGGRGITVCDRWRFGEERKSGFECFLIDVGLRPSPKHSIDRRCSDGDYEPANVRWATPIEQANNRRTNRIVVYRGNQVTLSQAVPLGGGKVTPRLASRRIGRGWSVDRAVETPVCF